MSITIRPVAPPNLPIAPNQYSRQFQDLAANINKQFNVSVANALNAIIANAVFNDATSGTSGTWTPRLAFSGDSTGMFYDLQLGQYQLLGEFVLATFQMILNVKGPATGPATLEDLPFPATNRGPGSMGVVSYATPMTGLTGGLTLDVAASTTTTTSVNIYQWSAVGITQTLDTNFTDTTAIYGGVIYPRS
jgi:hypothetical protein